MATRTVEVTNTEATTIIILLREMRSKNVRGSIIDRELLALIKKFRRPIVGVG